jgi:hypothetical protein
LNFAKEAGRTSTRPTYPANAQSSAATVTDFTWTDAKTVFVARHGTTIRLDIEATPARRKSSQCILASNDVRNRRQKKAENCFHHGRSRLEHWKIKRKRR